MLGRFPNKQARILCLIFAFSSQSRFKFRFHPGGIPPKVVAVNFQQPENAMENPENPSTAKRTPLTDMHKLALFGAGTLLCGTIIFMFTLNSVFEMAMRGRSGGSIMLTIGMTLAIGLLIAGGTVVSKCVSKAIKPILED